MTWHPVQKSGEEDFASNFGGPRKRKSIAAVMRMARDMMIFVDLFTFHLLLRGSLLNVDP
jgi:hypothetical protein